MVVSELYFERTICEHRIIAFGCYKEHKWTILSLGAYPTAYVENKTNIKDYDELKITQIKMHSYFNYCDTANWVTDDAETLYLGWDYGHLGDFLCLESGDFDGHRWTYEEILADVYSVIDQLVELEEKLKRGNKNGNEESKRKGVQSV